MRLRINTLHPLLHNRPKRGVTVLLTLLAILVVALNVFSIAMRPNVHDHSTIYLLELIIFGAFLIIAPRFRVDRLLICFCVVATISVIVNRPPAYIQASERLFFFIVMLGLLSPLVNNQLFQRFRCMLWRSSLILVAIAIVISAILFIPFAIERPGVIYTGLFGHPMLTAIMGAITAVAAIVTLIAPEIILGNNPRVSHYRLLRITLTVIVLVSAVVIMLAAGSRAAMLATVIAIIAICVICRKNLRVCTALGITTLSVVTLILLFPSTLTPPAARKTKTAIAHGSITYSRDRLWNARWSEFRKSPIIGIGFANHFIADNDGNLRSNIRLNDQARPTDSESTLPSTPSLTSEEGITQAKSSFIVNIAEPGSSWLSVISNTGILGFLIVVIFNIRLLLINLRALRKHPFENTVNSPALLYLPLLLLFWVHGMFEGWFLYAGSLTFFLYWLMTSRIYQLNHARNKQ